MAVYVVTWNINKEKANYDTARGAFIAGLEEYENKKDAGLESVRFISTDQTAYQIHEHLAQQLDADDRIFIVEAVKGRRQGRLGRSVWDWIKARS